MNSAKHDILALISAITALGIVVVCIYFFANQETTKTQENHQAKLFTNQKRGMKVAQRCIPCHDMTKERKITRTAPPLWGVFGQPAGSTRQFAYSPAYMKIADTGLIWNETTLNDYLKNPQAVIPGDTSTFTGIANHAERIALIDYLQSLREKIDPMDQPVFNRFSRPTLPMEELNTPARKKARGRIVAEQCSACHDLTNKRKNIIGPYLWKVVNRLAGTAEAFTYSSAFMQHTKMNLRWSPENLDQFIKAPKQFIPETRMLFAGVKNDQRRDDLIAFLQTLH